MLLKSNSFQEGESIPQKFTCDAENASPSLIIKDIPKGAKGLALIMDDPDATGGRTFTHWLMWNIPPETAEIKEGEIPAGAVQGKNGWARQEYGGPCPPHGSKPHRYMFKLYALDSALDIPADSEKSSLEEAMKNHILEQAMMTGLYAR